MPFAAPAGTLTASLTGHERFVQAPHSVPCLRRRTAVRVSASSARAQSASVTAEQQAVSTGGLEELQTARAVKFAAMAPQQLTSQQEGPSGAAPELVLDLGGKLLESPVYDARTNWLYFADINKGLVHALDLSAAKDDPARHYSIDVGAPVGTLLLGEEPGCLLAGLERALVRIDLQQRAVVEEIVCTPEEHGIEGFRYNDGRVSPAGTLVLNRKHESSDEPGGTPGRVYRLDWAQRTLVEVMGPGEVQLPNGMAWQGGELYLSDTGYNWLAAFACDAAGVPLRDADGHLQRRVVATFEEEEGVPDGIALDAAGNVWVALAKGAAVVAVHPQTGAFLHRIEMPVQMPTAVAFAGPGLEDLYITTTCLGGARGAGGLWRVRRPYGAVGATAAHVSRTGGTN